MKLENSFTIDAPVEKAWAALNSPETVAPCFPGATLTTYEGDSFSGTVKVKLGPIAMTYKGKGTYVTRDEAAHEVVIDASGRDSRGNGTATAKVTASLAADGPDKTAVVMVTDMTITGKPAQFGRGVISDVADKIIGQFSACVARKLAEQEGPAAEAPATVPAAAAAASEATSDIPTPSPAPRRSAARAAAGSEAISDSVAERAAESNGAAANGAAPATATPVAAAGVSEAEAPASTAMDPEPSAAVSVSSGTSEVEAPASTTMAPDPATSTPVTPATTTVRSAPPRPSGPIKSEVDAIDLLDTAGAPVLKRLVPVAGGGLLLLLVVLLVRRLRSV
jgi:carbon monoxide dehydrogenase subunit G